MKAKDLKVKSVRFESSHTSLDLLPKRFLAEFAFAGRSNVGKSSLINMIAGINHLAKTSASPGKTQTINHYLFNDAWFLVDLPGYGYAKTPLAIRENFPDMISDYISKREQLACVFILIDSRHVMQDNDIDFINYVGKEGVPVALVLTKTDKLSRTELGKIPSKISDALGARWESIPEIIFTSSQKNTGRDDILDLIEKALKFRAEEKRKMI